MTIRGKSDSPPMTDANKLRLLAAWFDMWDSTRYEDRQRLLDDEANPGKNEVQRDLRRIANLIESGRSQEPGSGEPSSDDREASSRAEGSARTPPPDFGQQILDLGGLNASWAFFLACVSFAIVVALVFR